MIFCQTGFSFACHALCVDVSDFSRISLSNTSAIGSTLVYIPHFGHLKMASPKISIRVLPEFSYSTT